MDIVSSDDELTVARVAAPPRYEFRSDLSDDSSYPQDEIGDSDTFSTSTAGPRSAKSIPTAFIDDITIPTHDMKRRLRKYAAADSLYMNGSTKRRRIANIEVALPWITQKKRAVYNYIRVPDWDGDLSVS